MFEIFVILCGFFWTEHEVQNSLQKASLNTFSVWYLLYAKLSWLQSWQYGRKCHYQKWG